MCVFLCLCPGPDSLGYLNTGCVDVWTLWLKKWEESVLAMAMPPQLQNSSRVVWCIVCPETIPNTAEWHWIQHTSVMVMLNNGVDEIAFCIVMESQNISSWKAPVRIIKPAPCSFQDNLKLNHMTKSIIQMCLELWQAQCCNHIPGGACSRDQSPSHWTSLCSIWTEAGTAFTQKVWV